MTEFRRLQISNKRDAAIRRCAEIEAKITAVSAGNAKPTPVWKGETEADARANYLGVLRQMLATEHEAVGVLTEDLARFEEAVRRIAPKERRRQEDPE